MSLSNLPQEGFLEDLGMIFPSQPPCHFLMGEGINFRKSKKKKNNPPTPNSKQCFYSDASSLCMDFTYHQPKCYFSRRRKTDSWKGLKDSGHLESLLAARFSAKYTVHMGIKRFQIFQIP